MVLAIWVALLAILGTLTFTVGGKLTNDFHIPSSEAQLGLNELNQRFPELSGTTAQIIFTTQDGSNINGFQTEIEQVLDQVRKFPDISSVASPFAKELREPAVSKDGTTALAQVNFTFGLDNIPPELKDKMQNLQSPDPKLAIQVGGQLYTVTEVPIGAMELIGVFVALIVLWVTFRSWRAALIPIITAGVGVSVAMAAILIAARFFAISTTTPSLAVMLGLAVGIDYALFIVFRHRNQLATGEGVAESIARAVATSGSAVIFAGSTVIIALMGLAVAKIPFLTVMGLAAAFAVFSAVIVAITLLPALLALWGEKLKPKRAAAVRPHGWVRFTTRFRIPVIIGVLLFAVLATIPAADLRLSLPDNGTAPKDSVAYKGYSLVSQKFGEGANAPLIITADIIQSRDPLKLMADWERQVATVEGVNRILISTPNRSADMGVIVVEPKGSQDSLETAQLVQRLRDDAPRWEKEFNVSNILVTGITAATIDISQQLGAALLPFTLVVVGLSLFLLLLVFRSLWVPLKATLGYLVSVGAAFGITSAVFIWGWGNSQLHIGQVGPVISFMPIMVMGVLFGLAMDYEVFLVSRMREDYVHGANAQDAIKSGYDTTAPVVSAAALIMIAVFAGFVPEGSFHVQPIAFGLAVGVFVDAFIVRMTLVPAVLSLLGNKAWYLPKWLDKRLPELDIEGTSLERRLEYERFEIEHGRAIIRIASDPPYVVKPGSCVQLHGDAPAIAALVAGICGNAPFAQRITVAGYDTVDEAAAVQARTCVIESPEYVQSQLKILSRQARAGIAQVVVVTNNLYPNPQVLQEVEDAGGAVLYWGAIPHRPHLDWQVTP